MQKQCWLFFLLLVCSLIIILFSSCSPTIKVIELQIPKSSIPEGIVVHPTTKEIFISSIHENELTKSTPDGKHYEVILKEMDEGKFVETANVSS